MEFGIGTFGEIEGGSNYHQDMRHYYRIQEILDDAANADKWGLDIFALGEHHRSDFVVSSPETVLSAIASVTEKIKLSSAVTVLSSSDPVRIFQRFATLDLISKGRAEVIAGRGSFIESFPLFGYNLQDYNDLFVEKLNLLLEINQEEVIDWSGKFRPGFERTGIYPRPYQKRLPVWIAVGGTPSSVVRAAHYGLPMVLGILGTDPSRFVSFTNLYRERWEADGFEIEKLQLGINEHMHIAVTHEQAIDEYWPLYGRLMNKIGKERGWPPMDKQDFRKLCEPDGSLLVGTPDEIVEKLIYQHGLFGFTRFIAQIIYGDMEHQKIQNSIELFAKEVVPMVKEVINKK